MRTTYPAEPSVRSCGGVVDSFDFNTSQEEIKYSFEKNGDVFSFHDTSLKAVFEEEKLRVSEAKGYLTGIYYNGLYTKQP